MTSEPRVRHPRKGVKPDPHEIEKFLRAVLNRYPPNSALELRALRKGAPVKGSTNLPVCSVRYVRPDDNLTDAAEWAAERSAGGASLYFGLNPRRQGLNRPGQRRDVLQYLILGADIDAHAGDPVDLSIPLKKAAKLGLPPPFATMDSGHGHWLLWIVESASQDDVTRALHDLSSDNVGDLPRIARLPGTINWRDPKHPVLAKLLQLDPAQPPARLFCKQEDPPVNAAPPEDSRVDSSADNSGARKNPVPAHVLKAARARGFKIEQLIQARYGQVARLSGPCPTCNAEHDDGSPGSHRTAYITYGGRLKCFRPQCPAFREDGWGGLAFPEWAPHEEIASWFRSRSHRTEDPEVLARRARRKELVRAARDLFLLARSEIGVYGPGLVRAAVKNFGSSYLSGAPAHGPTSPTEGLAPEDTAEGREPFSPSPPPAPPPRIKETALSSITARSKRASSLSDKTLSRIARAVGAKVGDCEASVPNLLAARGGSHVLLGSAAEIVRGVGAWIRASMVSTARRAVVAVRIFAKHRQEGPSLAPGSARRYRVGVASPEARSEPLGANKAAQRAGRWRGEGVGAWYHDPPRDPASQLGG